MKFKNYNLLKPLCTITQQSYWYFYPSELIYFIFFTLRHPVHNTPTNVIFASLQMRLHKNFSPIVQFSSRNFISFEMMMVFWTHPQSCIPKKEVKVKLLASSESSPLEVTKTRFRSWWLMNINEWGLGHSFRALSEIMNKISLEPNQPRGDCAQSCNTVGVTRPMHHTCIFHICTFYTHLPSWLARLARIWNSSSAIHTHTPS